MRHSHSLDVMEWALTVLNGIARSQRNGGRGSHRAKTLADVAAAEEQARLHGATDDQIRYARELPVRLRF